MRLTEGLGLDGGADVGSSNFIRMSPTQRMQLSIG
jgi:hypothetical protein